VPIFEPIIQAVWAHHSPRTTLRGPSPETRKFVVAQRADAEVDEEGREGGSLIEYLRRDARGAVIDTRYRLVGQDEMAISYDPYAGRDPGLFGFFGGGFAPWGGAQRSPGGFNPPPLPRSSNPPPPPRQYVRPLWRGGID
jgi:hypothetical protein